MSYKVSTRVTHHATCATFDEVLHFIRANVVLTKENAYEISICTNPEKYVHHVTIESIYDTREVCDAPKVQSR